MNNQEQWLREKLCHTPTESRKLPTCQPLEFSVKAGAVLPLGPATARFEAGVGVEDGEVKPKFQAKLEGLPTDLVDVAADEPTSQPWERRAYGEWSSKKARTPSHNVGKHGRGLRGAGH